LLRLLLATNNRGKVKEYRSLLESLPVELAVPGDLGIAIDVEETGSTYEENAALKAKALAAAGGMVSLADDSGLEVDALNGEPGVRSARYAGPGANDAARLKYLLGKLVDVPWNKRTARFVCVIAVAAPGGRVELCRGACEGIITFEPKGELGFGYDPVFYFPSLDRTMAELPMAEKNRVSHRGKAARLVPEALQKLGLFPK
jgi:XTP/dITP diphosphohydrolase